MEKHRVEPDLGTYKILVKVLRHLGMMSGAGEIEKRTIERASALHTTF